jgi:outer membrane protein assembly factor BamD (BamD/ComL family)
VPPAGDVLAQARQLMRAERFEEAAKEYEALTRSYTDSPEARTVLVSLAEVQLDRLGQPRQALDNLERYLSGGNGALVEEARRVRIRALHALGEREREKSAIDEFLHAHPRSFQSAALQHRLADLNARQ